MKERNTFKTDGKKRGAYQYYFEGYDSLISAPINCDGKNYLEDTEYYFAEFEAETSESDYHTFSIDYNFKGVYLRFRLNILDTNRFFDIDINEYAHDNGELLDNVKELLKENLMFGKDDDVYISEDGYLNVVLIDKKLDERVKNAGFKILECIKKFYQTNEIHITRMFGSFVFLKRIDGKLRAIFATPIPIKYCPLMIKLLKEVGGELADDLIKSLETSSIFGMREAMCELINKVVIDGGYFDTNRPLNSCEADVLFGASETMSSAFASDMIDAAVIVSNNLGTIITCNAATTQGAVKRMTGLFYTSPDDEILATASKEGIIPVFPYTARIDQLEGVKKAIMLGKKRIAVSVAKDDNYLHEELARLESIYDVKIYKFGLCSTGIDYETAKIMEEYADVIWSCASKYVKEVIEPSSQAQVGVKIPVHVMTKDGWEIVKNHLMYMSKQSDLVSICLGGDDKTVILNTDNGLKVLKKSEVRKCTDCPHPCV